jgi:hypothetical protein
MQEFEQTLFSEELKNEHWVENLMAIKANVNNPLCYTKIEVSPSSDIDLQPLPDSSPDRDKSAQNTSLVDFLSKTNVKRARKRAAEGRSEDSHMRRRDKLNDKLEELKVSTHTSLS